MVVSASFPDRIREYQIVGIRNFIQELIIVTNISIVNNYALSKTRGLRPRHSRFNDLSWLGGVEYQL
jgi:hypothetical protein